MAKPTSYYVCQNCGKRSAAYLGICPQCHEYGTLEKVTEQRETGAATRSVAPSGTRAQPQRLREVEIGQEVRYPVPVEEFSRVLGGGIVPGSITLIAGDPGIGKSTLMAQIAAVLAQTIGKVLYVSGEESARQIKMRADRLNLAAEDLFLVTETRLEDDP